jgi:hypothetical protein
MRMQPTSFLVGAQTRLFRRHAHTCTDPQRGGVVASCGTPRAAHFSFGQLLPSMLFAIRVVLVLLAVVACLYFANRNLEPHFSSNNTEHNRSAHVDVDFGCAYVATYVSLYICIRASCVCIVYPISITTIKVPCNQT